MPRRFINICAIFLLIPTLIAFRLWNIQIKNGDKYRNESKHIRAHVLNASRGSILTQDGLTLAVDRGVWDLFVVFKDFDKDPNVSLNNLNLLLSSISDTRYKKDLLFKIEHSRKKMKKTKDKELSLSNKKKLSRYLTRLIENQPHLLFKNVPAEIWIPLKTRPQDFPGFGIEMRTRRVYPQGQFAAHLIGRLGMFSHEDRKNHPYYLDLILRERLSHFSIATDEHYQSTVFYPEDTIGRNGLEGYYQSKLRGINGCLVDTQEVVNGKRKKRVIEGLSVPPSKGWDFYITVNSTLQRHCEKVLEDYSAERGGSVVIMNARTGDVKAMASYPSFTAGHITNEQIHDRIHMPLRNKCLETQTWPASVFKIVTSIAILEEGIANTRTQVPCNTAGYTAKGSRTVHCWHVNYGYSGHGPQNVSQAIANSCNMYYYHKGSQLSWHKLNHWARLFGFGQKTGIDLPHELRGQLPPQHGPGSGITNFCIGQGNLQVTTLQVATFMATVANRGKVIVPHLVEGIHSKSSKTISVSDTTWRAIEDGLKMTVDHGTAKQFPELKRHQVLGKTGTAETGKTKEGKKKPAHLWFAGYWKEKGEVYSFAICLLNAYKHVKKNGEEATSAGAIAEILKKYYKKPDTGTDNPTPKEE